MSLIRFVLWAVAFLVAVVCSIWAFGAIYYDFPVARGPAAIVFAVALLIALILCRGKFRKLALLFVAFGLVVAWWLTLKPSNDRRWQPDVAQTAWAEINGDEVTLHNVRNCEYRTETDYTPHWETRTVKLSEITGVDLTINYWGSPYMAHPIASFEFAGAPPLCFSIETRKEVGENYSAISGFYRQYELIYICADERDVIRLRTNYRPGEDAYLYHTTMTPAQAQHRFLDYLTTLNTMHQQPRWYNAATTNCTTSIRTQHATEGRMPWDWRILINGKADELLYERHLVATGGLSFAELKQRSLINQSARAADQDPEFSRRIRENLPVSAP